MDDELVHFFEVSTDLLCIAGLDGNFKRLNPAWTTRLGWPVAELVDRPFLGFVHADDRDATWAQFVRVEQNLDAVQFENRYRHRDGSYRWLRWSAHTSPERRLVYAIARDVTRLKRLESEMLDVVDRERERLGRDLHDGLCQTLAGIAALSAALARKLSARASPAGTAESAAAGEITELLHASIGEAHHMALDLGPVGLQDAPLDESLEILARNVELRFPVRCRLDCNAPPAALTTEVRWQLFRLAQEAVSNAVAHGRADRVTIGLDCAGGNGRLTVRDDGVGIPDGASRRDGIGLHTMACRASLIGGSLELARDTPCGTVVTCVFPLVTPSDEPEDPAHVATRA